MELPLIAARALNMPIRTQCSDYPNYNPFRKRNLIDGIDITSDEFYKRLEASDYIPTTSAPT